VSIIPPAAASTVQLVSGAVATAKTLRDLLRDTQDRDLKAAISDLYNEIIDIKARVLDLDEENRKLRTLLELKDEIIGPFDPHGYFYKRGDEAKVQPLCPKCFQSQPSNVVFMSPPKVRNGGMYRTCIVCNWHKQESSEQQRVQIPNSGSWWV